MRPFSPLKRLYDLASAFEESLSWRVPVVVQSLNMHLAALDITLDISSRSFFQNGHLLVKEFSLTYAFNWSNICIFFWIFYRLLRPQSPCSLGVLHECFNEQHWCSLLRVCKLHLESGLAQRVLTLHKFFEISALIFLWAISNHLWASVYEKVDCFQKVMKQ